MNNINFTRKTTRLKEYDYTTAGYYFITICTKDKQKYFGKIKEAKMYQTDAGKVAERNIQKLEEIYSNIKIEKYVIMPNHIHIILIIDKENNTSIPVLIKKYKEWITKEIGEPIWQKSYYDHVIRNEKDYLRIWEYIDENIIKWDLDQYYN